MKTKQNVNSSQMKNIFLLLLLVTGMVKAQIVNIPDTNFKAKLISLGIDTNLDNAIQVSEAQDVTGTLDISSASIQNLTGINAFVNITRLDCNYNLMTSVNIDLPNLTTLILFSNLLTTVSIANGQNLINVNVAENDITSMTFSTIPNVETLNLNGNKLPSLDFSTPLLNLRTLNTTGNTYNALSFPTPLPSLKTLNFGHPDLYSIALGNAPNLEYLNCYSADLIVTDISMLVHLKELRLLNCVLGSLDVTALADLEVLLVRGNPIRNLDLSQNLNLCQLSASDMTLLKTINMKNGSISCLSSIDLINNPQLRYVCADPDEQNYWQSYFISNSMPNVLVGDYCNFFPGGNYNTITGNIKYDLDANGCDLNDVIYPNIRVNINDGITQSANFTNTSGNYAFYTATGSFDVTPVVENQTWFTISPNSVTVPFDNINNNIATQDFCLSAIGSHSDVEIVLSVVTPARPGFDAIYKLVYRNKGTQVENVVIDLNFNDNLLNFLNASIAPDTTSFGFLSWNVANLSPFQSGSIDFRLHVNSPQDAPPVNNGNVLNFSTSINLFSDENLADNNFTLNQIVVGSFDPNDIVCLEGDVVASTEIGKYLHYAINFENTGTAIAENIVVKTEVNAVDFDINTLQLLNSNYPVDARITGDKIEFIFENINLPIGGHGHVLLKLKTQNTLMTGDAVANRGDIYFDYNFPIDTGLANTVFQTLSTSVFEVDSSVSIYPNPAANEVTIKADNKIKSIQLYDAQGRIVLTSLTDATESKLDVSSFSKGIYFVKITTEKGAQVQKLLKD